MYVDVRDKKKRLELAEYLEKEGFKIDNLKRRKHYAWVKYMKKENKKHNRNKRKKKHKHS